jgi:hypothetical protein
MNSFIESIQASIQAFGSVKGFIASRLNASNKTVYEVALAVYLFFTDSDLNKEVKYKSEREAIKILTSGLPCNIRIVQYWVSALTLKVDVDPNNFSILRYTKIQPLCNTLDSLNVSMVDKVNKDIIVYQYNTFKESIEKTKAILFGLCYKDVDNVLFDLAFNAINKLFSLSDKQKRENKELKVMETEEKALHTLAQSEDYKDMFNIQRDKEGDIEHVSFKDVITVADHTDLLRLFASLKTDEQKSFIDKFCAMNDIVESQNEKEINELRAKYVALKFQYKNIKMEYSNLASREQIEQLNAKFEAIEANEINEDFENLVGFSIN